jgi:hypothetical protein
MNSREVTAKLRGKKIARVELDSGGVSTGGGPLQAVVIYLDDGTRLSFNTQESPDGGDYGTSMMIATPTDGVFFTDKPGGRP